MASISYLYQLYQWVLSRSQSVTISNTCAFRLFYLTGNSGDEYEAVAVRHLNFVPFSSHTNHNNHFNHHLPPQHHLHQQTHLPTTPLAASATQPSLNYDRSENNRESGDINAANVNANTIVQNGHNSAAYDLEPSPLYAAPIGTAYSNHQQQEQHNHNNNKQSINLQPLQQNQQHQPTQSISAAAVATSATAPASASGSAHPMYKSFFGSKAHAEDFFTQLARLRGRDDSICGLDIRERGVYAKVRLCRGTRYGPFAVKLCSEPTAPSLAWEVSVRLCVSEIKTQLKLINLVQWEIAEILLEICTYFWGKLFVTQSALLCFVGLTIFRCLILSHLCENCKCGSHYQQWSQIV